MAYAKAKRGLRTVRKVSAKLDSKRKAKNANAKKIRRAPKRTDLPTIVERSKKEKLPAGIAYAIKDAHLPTLYVLTSANAWWLDRVKVSLLIAAYKGGASDVEACYYAGITLEQYKYFKEKHPQFSEIKQLCLALPDLRARTNVVNALDTDRDTAKWWLSNKRSDEFSPKSKVAHEGGVDARIIDPAREAATKKLLAALTGNTYAEPTIAADSANTEGA